MWMKVAVKEGGTEEAGVEGHRGSGMGWEEGWRDLPAILLPNLSLLDMTAPLQIQQSSQPIRSAPFKALRSSLLPQVQ